MSTTDLHTADPVDVEETTGSGQKTCAMRSAKRSETRNPHPQQGQKIWIDGKLVEKDDAKISVYDHGLLYGDGVFEGIRVYNGQDLRVRAHLERLYDSALRDPAGDSDHARSKFKAAIEQTVKANNFTDCYIRAVVTRGVGYLGLDPQGCTAQRVHHRRHDPALPEGDVREGHGGHHRVGIDPQSPQRVSAADQEPELPQQHPRQDRGRTTPACPKRSCSTTRATSPSARATTSSSCATGVVLTPPPTDGILEGITRKVIWTSAASTRRPVRREDRSSAHDLYIADECFLTGTGAEVIPVTKIDGRVVGDGHVGPVTKKLTDAFHKHVRE